jgi:hypothetical protein
MPGARCTRSLESKKGNKCSPAVTVTTSTPETPSIPRAMVYGLLRALPGDRALLTPSLADYSTSLTPTAEASGPHDLTVRLWCLPSSAPSASIASCPASVTIASRPSEWGQDKNGYTRDPHFCKSEYFFLKGLTANR